MRFFVTPAYDAYVLEQMVLRNANQNLSLKIEIKSRSGKFLVDAGDAEIEDDGEFCLSEFPEGEICFIADRFEVTFDFLDAAIDEEEKLALISGFHEDSISHLEGFGWEVDRLEYFICGGILLDECLVDDD
jgi:hypothetical protein